MDSGSWIQDPGPRILDPGSRTQEPGSRIRDPGSVIQDPGSRILDPGSMILDHGSWILDPGVPWIQDPAFSYGGRYLLVRGTLMRMQIMSLRSSDGDARNFPKGMPLTSSKNPNGDGTHALGELLWRCHLYCFWKLFWDANHILKEFLWVLWKCHPEP